MAPAKPTYDLLLLQSKCRRRFERLITGSAADGARALGLSEGDIWECVSKLERAMFKKTMQSQTYHGLWQDVYYAPFRGQILYVKLQLTGDDKVVVVSFKKK